MQKVVVIGGGPAGMMASIKSAEEGNKVIIIEKMQMLGKKLLITGKGRCNITSSLDINDFIKNTPSNGKFLYSAYKNYTNENIIQFLNQQGLKVKEERGNRIFPVTDKSIDVLNCFIKRLKELNVEIMLNTKVKNILTETHENQKIEKKKSNKHIIGVETEKERIMANKVILATGGMSYPATGSTGDGYEMAKKMGHVIKKIKPSLIPYEIYEKEIASKLQGLGLKNTQIKLIHKTKNKEIYKDFGEMLFTHYGVSGPIILSSSAHLVRYKNIDQLLKNKEIILQIDLKPALNEEVLNKRIIRDFEEFSNKQYKNSLNKLLPKNLIPVIIEQSQINPEKKVNEITKQERKQLIKALKQMEITIKKFRPIEEAIITSGGISTKEINPKTMESKLVNGLYFAGEIIDIDAYTGGFNLQIAYSTGYTAGCNKNNL